MKAMVIYDSVFGNTEKVAQAIGGSLAASGEVEVCRVETVSSEQLAGVTLLIVGSPTRAFRPTQATSTFLNSLSRASLKGVRVAAFDTRINAEDTKSGILKVFVKFFGYAAKPIADHLKNSGGELIAQPEGFYVKDTEGPLKDNELERASIWAKQLTS